MDRLILFIGDWTTSSDSAWSKKTKLQSFQQSMQQLAWHRIPDLQLHDGQGRRIPMMGMRDLEVHLLDETGKKVVLREYIAISSSVHQPIFALAVCLRMDASGSEQSLTHVSRVKVPIELQNRSIVVKGSIRAISCNDVSAFVIT